MQGGRSLAKMRDSKGALGQVVDANTRHCYEARYWPRARKRQRAGRAEPIVRQRGGGWKPTSNENRPNLPRMSGGGWAE